MLVYTIGRTYLIELFHAEMQSEQVRFVAAYEILGFACPCEGEQFVIGGIRALLHLREFFDHHRKLAQRVDQIPRFGTPNPLRDPGVTGDANDFIELMP